MKSDCVNWKVVCLSLLIAQGCRAPLDCAKLCPPRTDTIVNSYIDTLLIPYEKQVFIKGESITNFVEVNCDSMRAKVRTSGKTSFSQSVTGRTVQVRLRNECKDSLLLLNDTITALRARKELTLNHKQTIEVERKLTWWERTKIDLGGYAIGLIAGAVALAVGRYIAKIYI